MMVFRLVGIKEIVIGNVGNPNYEHSHLALGTVYNARWNMDNGTLTHWE